MLSRSQKYPDLRLRGCLWNLGASSISWHDLKLLFLASVIRTPNLEDNVKWYIVDINWIFIEIFVCVWSVWVPWCFIVISCLVDIFYMPLHISSCSKGFVAVRTWNIFMYLLMLRHLLVVYKRFWVFFACSRHAHPKARLGFVHPFIMVVEVGFWVGLVLANVTRVGLQLLCIQTVAFLVLDKPVFFLQDFSTLVALNLLPYFLFVDRLHVSVQRCHCQRLLTHSALGHLDNPYRAIVRHFRCCIKDVFGGTDQIFE